MPSRRRYDLGIVERNDVLLAQAWLSDLVAIGYRFPALRHLRNNATASGAR